MTPERLDDFFALQTKVESDIGPVLLYSPFQREDILVKDPVLQDIGFPSVMDPFTAFQELTMWLGAQARPEKDLVEISDEIMRDEKGFDEWSFKNKAPGAKKLRRKENKRRKRERDQTG